MHKFIAVVILTSLAIARRISHPFVWREDVSLQQCRRGHTIRDSSCCLKKSEGSYISEPSIIDDNGYTGYYNNGAICTGEIFMTPTTDEVTISTPSDSSTEEEPNSTASTELTFSPPTNTSSHSSAGAAPSADSNNAYVNTVTHCASPVPTIACIIKPNITCMAKDNGNCYPDATQKVLKATITTKSLIHAGTGGYKLTATTRSRTAVVIGGATRPCLEIGIFGLVIVGVIGAL